LLHFADCNPDAAIDAADAPMLQKSGKLAGVLTRHLLAGGGRLSNDLQVTGSSMPTLPLQ
jgi:hypothetical protein